MRRMMGYSETLRPRKASDWNRFDLEKGDKILLPASALNSLANNKQLQTPWIFCLQNTFSSKQIYAGVLEFVAPEGQCIVPNWMYTFLQCYDGVQIIATVVPQIPKGKFIKIQPHNTAFIELSNPRAILEKELLNYTCLMQGGQINIQFMNKNYLIDILEVKNIKNEVGDYKAIKLTDADIEVDFEKPLDYIEELPNLIKRTSSVKFEEEKQKQQTGDTLQLFQGQCVRIDGKQPTKTTQEPTEIKETTYNPRQHKLKNGIKAIEDYQGSGQQIGQATQHEQKVLQQNYQQQQKQVVQPITGFGSGKTGPTVQSMQPKMNQPIQPSSQAQQMNKPTIQQPQNQPKPTYTQTQSKPGQAQQNQSKGAPSYSNQGYAYGKKK